MRKKNYKGRCEKRVLNKCKAICKTYDPVQAAYANILADNSDVAEIRCNIPLDGEYMSEYMTDFVCVLTDGTLMVRECVQRKFLTKPLMIKMLDASREYWMKRGADWGIVVDEAIAE